MFNDLNDSKIFPKISDYLQIQEVKVSKELQDKIKKVLDDTGQYESSIGNYSSIVKQQTSGQYVFFPNQYYLIALKCKDYAISLLEYCNFLDEKKSDQMFKDALNSNDFDTKTAYKDAFDTDADKSKFTSFLTNPDLGKSAIDSKGLRQTKDIFGSRILAKLKIPNASSGFLGDLIYHLYKDGDIIYDIEKEIEIENINNNKDNIIKQPTQRIFYGAPGTGKSYAIKKLTEGKNVIRTTFHPDSDYSTFVGCYKPTTKPVPMRDVTGKVIRENGKDVTEDRIIYKFVPQAFLKAYLGAWKKYAEATGNNLAPQYLVIEEINRGNCAQIFGDLFQLLDRQDDNGFSEYPIEADTDLQQEIERAFKEEFKLEKDINVEGIIKDYTSNHGATLSEDIQAGRVLLLPNNLYIWATMNTSDQSLFPIDSAFKRRWDWEYVPIHNCNKGWRIAVNNDGYDWWEFIEKINEQIGSTTNSEDKKLGYFFCKADNDGIVSAEKFVNKVIFYLWNDVFKDFGFDDTIFKDEDGSQLSFNKFYTTENGKAKVADSKVELFLTNLGLQGNPIEQDISKDSVSDTWFKPNSVIFKITDYPTNPDELYERARGNWWMAADRAEKIEYFYAYASPVQKIVACYKVTSYSAEPDNNGKIRYKFEGEFVPDDPMIGKPVEKIAHATGGVVFYPENINK